MKNDTKISLEDVLDSGNPVNYRVFEEIKGNKVLKQKLIHKNVPIQLIVEEQNEQDNVILHRLPPKNSYSTMSIQEI